MDYEDKVISSSVEPIANRKGNFFNVEPVRGDFPKPVIRLSFVPNILQRRSRI
jgi:hypothetical protein